MPMPKPTKFGISALRDKVKSQLAEINPTECPNRLAIVFDDSGSMSGEKFSNAKTAVRNFTQSCNQFDTSLAIIPLGVQQDANKEKPLTIDYDVLNLFVTTMSLNTCGTPLYTVMTKILSDEDDVTRLVVFSDGEPTDDNNFSSPWDEVNENKKTKKETWLNTWKKLKHEKEFAPPHDTVFIGEQHESGYAEMKWIAEQTGGIFIHFKDSLSLSSGLKYLAPALRGLLASPEMKDKIQKGENI